MDGIRLNNAIYRSGHLQNALTVDPFAVSGVSATGPDRSNSGDALGGVIHYRTRNPAWRVGARARAQWGFSSAARSPLFHADAEAGPGL